MTASRCSLIAITLVAITGCTLRPNLVAAHVKAADETEVVEVVIRSSDAKTIKDREIYFSIVVTDCEDSNKRFPIRPFVAGQLATDFDFPAAGEFVTIHGSIPRHAYVEYAKPCVVLQGGSYVFDKLESAPITLVRLTEDQISTKGGRGR